MESEKFLVENLIKQLSKNKEIMFDVRKEIPSIRNPADLNDILRELGWRQNYSDDNYMDCWLNYRHTNYNFDLTMAYNGYYWQLRLYRTDIDDE